MENIFDLMIKYTAGYVNTHNNFVIQNKRLINKSFVDNKFFPSFCLIKNFLQRDNPVKPSMLLQKYFWKIEESVFIPLISRENPIWENTIKWQENKDNNPALKFYNLLPKYLEKKYLYVQQLICPEVPINFITQSDNEDFQDQVVDFYLPQALLVIEIDGRDEHWLHWYNDKERDTYLGKYGIKTIRIDTKDIHQESVVLSAKIQEVQSRIDKVFEDIQDKKGGFSHFLSYDIVDYENRDVLDSLALTAIIRFQIFVLEILMRGEISLDQDYIFQIKTKEKLEKRYFDLALEDLWEWLKNCCILQNISFPIPNWTIELVANFSDFWKNKKSSWSGISRKTKDNDENKIIKIDFSLFKRWTDEFLSDPTVFFIRTDYFEVFDWNEVYNLGIRGQDYFQMTTTSPIDYKITDEELPALRFFLKNLIGYDDFRPWQWAIIQNILSNRDTLGLLPTGSGKSLCFHIACLLQPTINFVVCPIKSLMVDQEQELKNFWIGRVASITSDDSVIEKNRKMLDFRSKKLFLVLISPERFQTKEFRKYLNSLDHMAYAVIDEIHCLSEWGHDFRTSYLCLAKTIRRYCKGIKFLGLTATASVNVLKDIQIELGIVDKVDVKTLSDFSRPELEFIVQDDEGRKRKALIELLEKNLVWQQEHKNGIIFTPYVNGDYGCYDVSKDLERHFGISVGWFAGSVPTIKEKKQVGNSVIMEKKAIFSESEFTQYKLEIQRRFKDWEISLLSATKAFGMGINKKDVHFTVPYGIPSSMEALYQEGGRAGRDKEKLFRQNGSAKCYVLLWTVWNEELLNDLFDVNSDYKKINDAITRLGFWGGDVWRNFFFWNGAEEDLDLATKNIISLYEKYLKNKQGDIVITGGFFQNQDEEEGEWKDVQNSYWDKTEKYLYRLMLLGVIADYTVSWGWRKSFRVLLNSFDDFQIRENLKKYIEKYENFALEKYEEQFSNLLWLEKGVRILLQRSYDHHSYHRRQSLKNLYENCLDVIGKGENKITNSEFKKRIEDYFKMDEDVYLLQDIADSLEYLDKWTSLLWKKEGVSLIDKKQAESLKSSLSRLLESYQNSLWLNLISGMLRLYLGQFDDRDGRPRLERAFDSLCKMDKEFRFRQIEFVLNIGKMLESEQKSLLSLTLFEFFPGMLEVIYEVLQDDYSLWSFMLPQVNEKLLSTYKELYEKVGWIEW